MPINKLSQIQERSSMIKLFYDYFDLGCCSMNINKLSKGRVRSSMIKLFYD